MSKEDLEQIESIVKTSMKGLESGQANLILANVNELITNVNELTKTVNDIHDLQVKQYIRARLSNSIHYPGL
jgi:hypothetical protein